MEHYDQKQEQMVRAELDRLITLNPESVPIYFIVSETDQSQLPPEVPIMLFGKGLTIDNLVNKLRLKFPEYPHIYLFGEDHSREAKSQMSLKEKRKQKGRSMGPSEDGPRLILAEKEVLSMKVGDAHERYKDHNNCLVTVMSKKRLHRVEPPKVKEIVLIVLALLVAGLYLFLALNGDGKEQGGNMETSTL